MKSFLIFVFFSLLLNNLIAQVNDRVLYIYEDNPIINSDEIGKLHYLISIKSKDSLFQSDGYKFIIPNQIGFDQYESLQKVGVVVSLDTIRYKSIDDLKKITNWELHEFLSIQQSIYLVTKQEKSYSNNQNIVHFLYPLIYEGTQKNINMIKF